MGVRKTKEQFIEEAQVVHGNKYEYTEVQYKNSHTKVRIICKIHGEFSQAPSVHLSGCGCKQCGARKAGNKMAKGADIFKNEADILHNKFYNYDHVNYINSFTKVIISCPRHGIFEQVPHDHIRGRGCQICGDEIKNKKGHNKPTTLYQFKINDVWKIGITTRLLSIRYSMDYKTLENIEEYSFNTGLEAYQLEQQIIRENTHLNYCGNSPFKDATGTTECFTKKINLENYIN